MGNWNKKYGKPEDYKEIVALSIRYKAPNHAEGRINGSLDFENHKTILVAVNHTDAPEIKWSDNFTFNVDEGDSSVDITSILSATLHGDPDCIEYKIAGWVDDSGCIYTHGFYTGDNGILADVGEFRGAIEGTRYGSRKAFNDLSENFDLSMVKDFDGRSGMDTNYDGDTADATVTYLVLNPTDP